MHRSNTPIALLAMALLVFAAGIAGAAETAQSVIQKADANLYYPQKAGLQGLQADAQSSFLAQRLQNNPEAKNIKLEFFWSQPYKHRFRLTGVPNAMSYEAGEFERQLTMWGDFLMPKPLDLTLANYKTKLTENETAFVIDGRTTATGEFFYERQYTIDKKTMLPTKWRLASYDWTADVNVKFVPVVPGKHVVAEMKAQANGTQATIKITWKAVEKWTLADSLTFSFTGGDGSEQTSTVRLSNFKLNQPIPAGVFPAKP